MYGKSHWWNVTSLFPSRKRHLLGGATEKRTESDECWDPPATTKSTWECVECLVWQKHLAFYVHFSRKKSFFEAKMWREDIQHQISRTEKSKKVTQPWCPLLSSYYYATDQDSDIFSKEHRLRIMKKTRRMGDFVWPLWLYQKTTSYAVHPIWY